MKLRCLFGHFRLDGANSATDQCIFTCVWYGCFFIYHGKGGSTVKLSQSLEKFTAKERLMVIITIGMIVLLITVYTTSSEEVVAPNAPSKTNTDTSNKVIMPIGNQTTPLKQVTRDPFAVPPEFKEKPPSMNSQNYQADSIVHSNSDPISTKTTDKALPTKQRELLKLTGIVGSEEQRLAVIQSKNKSKAYRINDFIGTYQLVAINVDSILLQDNGSQLVLPLEAATQKGGNK